MFFSQCPFGRKTEAVLQYVWFTEKFGLPLERSLQDHEQKFSHPVASHRLNKKVDAIWAEVEDLLPEKIWLIHPRELQPFVYDFSPTCLL